MNDVSCSHDMTEILLKAAKNTIQSIIKPEIGKFIIGMLR